MKTPVVYSPDHRFHDTDTGIWVGVPIPSEEVPARAEIIVDHLRSLGHEVLQSKSHDDSVLESVHDVDLIEYLRTAHEKWEAWGYGIDPGQPIVTAYAFPTERFLGGRPLRRPRSPGALAGVYAMDTMTRIGPGTYRGARAAVDMAQTAAEHVGAGAVSAYAVCRPPGHHSGPGFFGGSCYLNNAAVAAETLVRSDLGRVMVIDLDAHHGNGTQEIFYRRSDVVYGSVHVDPADGWFPHFVGHADEVGVDAGDGANHNLPLPAESEEPAWLEAVDSLIDWAASHEAGALVVSLGVDAAVSDPESPLRVTESGYREAGERIASLGLPTVFIQEGGYDLATIGGLVASTLAGFDSSMGDGEA
ncbi:MAG: histone deacetylase family protein [Acidimicrobiia bacterium]